MADGFSAGDGLALLGWHRQETAVAYRSTSNMTINTYVRSCVARIITDA